MRCGVGWGGVVRGGEVWWEVERSVESWNGGVRDSVYWGGVVGRRWGSLCALTGSGEKCEVAE